MRLVARCLLLLCAFALAVMASAPASALDPTRTLPQYKHSRWIVDDGAPAGIAALAQGRDGYLWIGARDGLYRFDGVNFEKFEPEQVVDDRVSISALHVASDGAVWVGYQQGGVAVLRNGVLRDANIPRGGYYVMKILEGPDHAIWVQVGRGENSMARWANGRWREFGPAEGLPDDYPINAVFDRGGALWVSMTKGLLVMKGGAGRFERRPETLTGHAALSLDGAGRVWVSDDAGSRAISAAAGERAPPATTYPSPKFLRGVLTFFDRNGSLWGLANSRGLFRTRVYGGERFGSEASPRLEFFGTANGLLSDSVSAMLEDHEGNLWFGTALGLERFRTADVVVEPDLTAVGGLSIYGATDGAVYVGASDTLFRILPGSRPQALLTQVARPDAICEGPDQSVWIMLADKLVRVRDGRVTSSTLPSALRGAAYDCAVDRRNVLWISAFRDGLFRLIEGRWEQLMVPPRPGALIPTAMIAGRDRELHVLMSPSSLRSIDYPSHRDLTFDPNGPLSSSQMLYQGAEDLILGGGFGIARLHNGRFQFVLRKDYPALGGVFGMTESGGDTWLLTKAGIVRVSTAALHRAFDDPAVRLQLLVLNFRDGMPSGPKWDGKREVVRGGDGRLWFATSTGAVWVDPQHLGRNPNPPRVTISALTVGGRRYRDPVRITLPAGTSSGQIDYTALSLSVPERIQFRYRLDGLNKGWVDPGSRRQMFFTNLGPGTYRFHVIASNNDGVWNREGATLEFTIPPTFLQSVWFQLVIVLLFAALVWFVYSMRLRQETARVRGELETRLAERERIARELHDTLLQGFQGLMLRFQSVAERIPKKQPLRKVIDDALDQADAVLVEGRDRVQDLRSSGATVDLAQSLIDCGVLLAGPETARFDLTVEGQPRALHPVAREEMQRIGEEAIRNAFHHAQARGIEVALTYRSDQLSLNIRDDGVGLPAEVVSHGEPEGHFGLIGMRERAGRLGGVLTVSSRPGAGTEVLLFVPARAAYAVGSGGWWNRLLQPFKAKG